MCVRVLCSAFPYRGRPPKVKLVLRPIMMGFGTGSGSGCVRLRIIEKITTRCTGTFVSVYQTSNGRCSEKVTSCLQQ